jgi:hypothetical protein
MYLFHKPQDASTKANLIASGCCKIRRASSAWKNMPSEDDNESTARREEDWDPDSKKGDKILDE